MKGPQQKKTAPGAGFVIQMAAMAFAAVCCIGISCGFARAYFVTERAAADNEVKIASYSVTVYPEDSDEPLATDGMGRATYICPLAQDDLHLFYLMAEGTAYSGHCTVTVTSADKTERHTIDLVPGDTGAAAVQAAEGCTLTFAFNWGAGEDAMSAQSASAVYAALGQNSPAAGGTQGGGALYFIPHSETPHLEYTVAEGASLSGIASYYGVSLDALRAYNGLTADPADPMGKAPLEAGLTLSVPYASAENFPEAYLPRGVLAITVDSAGDALTPEWAEVWLTGPYGIEERLPYSWFQQGSYTCPNAPAGEYTITLVGAERENYTLETLGATSAAVTENGAAELRIQNTYTRHRGNLVVSLGVTGAELPQSAVVRITGPEGTYDRTLRDFTYYPLYSRFICEMPDLPTGTYTAELLEAAVEGYALKTTRLEITVARGETRQMELTAEYTKKTGDLTIRVAVTGAQLPGGAYLEITGADGATQRVPCAACTLTLPVGTYRIAAAGLGIDGHTAESAPVTVTLTEGGAAATVLVTYTPIPAETPAEPESPGTTDTPAEPETPDTAEPDTPDTPAQPETPAE